MFFLIGGIQPKTIKLDETPRICSACGLAQARLRRVDHYISLFFLPLFSIKKGVPVLICDRCGAVTPPGQPYSPRTGEFDANACARCGQPVSPEFRFCPGCGSPL